MHSSPDTYARKAIALSRRMTPSQRALFLDCGYALAIADASGGATVAAMLAASRRAVSRPSTLNQGSPMDSASALAEVIDIMRGLNASERETLIDYAFSILEEEIASGVTKPTPAALRLLHGRQRKSRAAIFAARLATAYASPA